LGIACLADFMISWAIRSGLLVPILTDYTVHTVRFRLLRPSSMHLSLRLRVFFDFIHARLFAPPAVGLCGLCIYHLTR
ncbi:LysR family transcriptional regulator, partial [Pseudomonas syringae pv. tagetis]